jgi:Spy/CpxP family protein refolding chaperone
MKRWKIITSVALVFILGLMVGIVGTGVVIKRSAPFGPRGPEGRKALFMQRLERKLDLTAAQKTRVAAIVDRRHARARDRFRRHRQQMHAFMAEGFADIRKELTPEQQVKLDALQAEMEVRFKKRGRHFHHPPGP